MTELLITDEQLVVGTLVGDNDNFAALVDRYWPIAVALSASRIEDFNEAEDIAQKSFIKAHQYLHKLKDRSRFGGWVSKIVIQECNSYFRSQKKAKLTSFSEGLENIPAPVTTNPGLTASQKHFIRSAVSKLAEKYRTVIIMRFIGGLNSTQIAGQLGQKPNTVRVWLHRAYKMLKDNLAPIAREVDLS
jgi:RNA polymerase sigma-70 factor (ECF subfamily)